MASSLINVNSALNYIAGKMGVNISVVRSFFPNESANRTKALNIKSAHNIIARVVQIGFGVNVSQPTVDNLQAACSANTFKALYNRAMPSVLRVWNIKTDLSQMKYDEEYRALQPSTLGANLKGGGGGGSGGCYTWFAGSGSMDIPAGAAGGTSYIYKNGTPVISAAGGAGGAGQTASNGGQNGSAGNAGSPSYTKTGSVTLIAGDYIIAVKGKGGGGSGGGIKAVQKNIADGGHTLYSPVGNNGGSGGIRDTGTTTKQGAGGGGGGGGPSSNGGPGDSRNGGTGYTGYSGGIMVGIIGTFNYGGDGGSAIGTTVATGGSGGTSAGAPGGQGSMNTDAAGGGGGGASGSVTLTLASGTILFNEIKKATEY